VQCHHWLKTLVKKETSSTVAAHVCSDRPANPGRPAAPRAEAIAKVLKFIETHDGKPVHLPDLCASASVSARTLRAMFIDVFGISPNRYLRVRKLHLIRAALAVADYFDIDPKRTPPIGFHPHSGIATLTLLLEGQISCEETSGTKSIIEPGGVE
jgi:redox-sensitive bicupin YhaK (pirin superfamily)